MSELPELEPEPAVLGASAMVDLLAGTDYAAGVATRIRRTTLHAPALLDAEVLSALGRLHRAGNLTAEEVEGALAKLNTAPVNRHPLTELVNGAWQAASYASPTPCMQSWPTSSAFCCLPPTNASHVPA